MEPLSIDEALQYCLDNPDNLSEDELLGRFPRYREELAPLLALDRQLNRTLPTRMPTESKALIRQRLVNRMVAHQASELPRGRIDGKSSASRVGNAKAPRWLNRVIAGATAVIIVLVLWWSATTSLPGNPLYPVKLGTENLLLNFAGTSAALIRDHINLSNLRLADIRTMQARNALSEAGPAIDNYYDHIRNALTLWEERPDDKDTDLAKIAYSASVAGQRVLGALGEGAEKPLSPELRSEVSNSLTEVGNLQTSSAGVLRGAGINLDQVLQETNGTVASLLVSAPATGTPSPSATAMPTPGTPTTGVTQATSTANILTAPTLTAVLYAAQTTIADAGSASNADLAAAKTVIVGAGTPLSTPVLHAVQTVLAQPTPVLSVGPRVASTPFPGATVLPIQQPTLTALPITAVPTLPITAVPTLGLTTPTKVGLPTLTIPLPTTVPVRLPTVTAVVPKPTGVSITTLTPTGALPTIGKLPTSLPVPRLPKP